MATINNIKGTSYQSFLIGKRGTTVYQGSDVPANIVTSPLNGDIYLQKGLSSTDQGLWQYVGAAWIKLQVTNSNLVDISNTTKSPNIVLGTDSTGNSITGLTAKQVSTILGLGTSAYTNTGTESGNIPLLDSNGKIPVSTLPSIAITDVFSVADINARDALQAHEGDIAIVTSNSTSYIYDGSKWQAIGSAGSVSGISGPKSSIKTGVVTLDAADILTGTLEVSQGGTGVNTVSDGDILVGSGSSFSKLGKSTEEGDALIISSGEVAWGKISSKNTTYTGTSSGLTSTNISDALDEIADTRIKITATVADPTPTSDNTLGYKIGDMIINTTTGKIFQSIDVEKGKALWQKIGSTVKPENTFYVSLSGSDAENDGSASFPYATISKALLAAPTGSSVVIYPGTYHENLSITQDDTVISSLSGNVIINGGFSTTADNVMIKGLTFASTTTAVINISSNNNIVFKNCSMDNTISIILSGSVGTGVAFFGCEILGTVTINSTSTNSIIFRDSYGFGLTMAGGTVLVSSSTNIQSVNHTGGYLYINNVSVIEKNTSDVSITSSASMGAGNYLLVSNSSLQQYDNSFGSISITGGVHYSFNDVVFDPTYTLPESGRIYNILSKDIGVQGSFTNVAPGENIQTALLAIDAQLGKISNSAITSFNKLKDVTSYTSNDSNKIVQINSTGTGVVYGPILGTAAQNNTTDFATAAEGTLASTAVQPGNLSVVATSGKFVDLIDGPGMMGPTNASKVLRVNAGGTSLEFGPTLSKVANTGNYSDLNNIPTFSTVATTGKYSDLSDKPALGTASTKNIEDFATAEQGTKADTAVQPSSLAPVATTGFFTSLGDCPHTMTSTDVGKVLRVSPTGNSIEYGPILSTVATTGKYTDLTDTPTLSDGSIDLKVKSIESDNSNILSDGTGNLNIVGKLTTGSFILPSSKYENVSSAPAIGQLQLITNGRKPGEAAGSGTGVLCIFDGTSWMDVSSGTTVII